MGAGIWHKFGLTGGGAEDVEGIDTLQLVESRDVCHTIDVSDNYKYWYHVFMPLATDAHNPPTRIRPANYSARGSGVWYGSSSPYGDIQVKQAIVSGLPTEADKISGGDIKKASASTATISATSCLDDAALGTQLHIDTASTVTVPHTGSLAANTIYFVFITKLTGGTLEYRFYTSEAAAAADSGVSYKRFLGFLRTNAAAQLCDSVQVGNLMLFGKASENVVSAGITTTAATVTHSSFIPESRILEIEYGARDASVTDQGIFAIDNGTDTSFYIGTTGASTSDTGSSIWSKGGAGDGLKPYLSTRQFKSSSGTLDLLIHSVRVRR